MKLKTRPAAVLRLPKRKNASLAPLRLKKAGLKLKVAPKKSGLKLKMKLGGHPKGRLLELDELESEIWYAVTVFHRLGYGYAKKVQGHTLINSLEEVSPQMCLIPKKVPNHYFSQNSWLDVSAGDGKYFSVQPIVKKSVKETSSVGGQCVPLEKLIDKNYYLFGVYTRLNKKKCKAVYHLVRGSALKRTPSAYDFVPLYTKGGASPGSKGLTRTCIVELKNGYADAEEFLPDERKGIHKRPEYRFIGGPPVLFDEAQRLSRTEFVDLDDPDAIV